MSLRNASHPSPPGHGCLFKKTLNLCQAAGVVCGGPESRETQGGILGGHFSKKKKKLKFSFFKVKMREARDSQEQQAQRDVKALPLIKISMETQRASLSKYDKDFFGQFFFFFPPLLSFRYFTTRLRRTLFKS